MSDGEPLNGKLAEARAGVEYTLGSLPATPAGTDLADDVCLHRRIHSSLGHLTGLSTRAGGLLSIVNVGVIVRKKRIFCVQHKGGALPPYLPRTQAQGD